jgi:hypothetical protein
MKPRRCLGVSLRFICGVWAIFCLVGLSVTNAQDKSPAATKSQPQQATVITNENMLSLPRAPRIVVSPSPQLTEGNQKASAASAPTHDPSLKAAEITSLQKELKDKQKHIELLMRLFVADERRWVQFPTDEVSDPAAKARIRFEQDELLAESAACARIQAKLNALTAGTAQP